ncbi:MAG: 3-dehydroquinate dehydratase [Erysipelotrichales bacterium]|nr:3-dehydroquinate dehydratase [Erysipelotrichales bacterium]
MEKKILIINGPNLNLLKYRDPLIYSHNEQTFQEYFNKLKKQYNKLEYYQSNHEGDLIDKIQEVEFDSLNYYGIVINAGGYTHTSITIRDAIEISHIPIIEVHISNIVNRENFRKESLLSPVCSGSIIGLGLDGYNLGIQAILNKY